MICYDSQVSGAQTGGSSGSRVIAEVAYVAEIRWACSRRLASCRLSLHVASHHSTLQPELPYNMAAGAKGKHSRRTRPAPKHSSASIHTRVTHMIRPSVILGRDHTGPPCGHQSYRLPRGHADEMTMLLSAHHSV